MSGIYIPGMEMPTNCYKCLFKQRSGMNIICAVTNEQFSVADVNILYYRLDDCPLIPVPDHGQQDGLYPKYFVIKTETGEIVQDCFVLRPQKDKAAVAALLLYAKETKNQELSRDIREWLSTIIPADKEEEG